MQDFQKQIYDEVKRLFPDGTVEAQICRPALAMEKPGTFDPAVRLVHNPSGIEMICSEFPTQIENYIAAAIRLRVACDKPNT